LTIVTRLGIIARMTVVTRRWNRLKLGNRASRPLNWLTRREGLPGRSTLVRRGSGGIKRPKVRGVRGMNKERPRDVLTISRFLIAILNRCGGRNDGTRMSILVFIPLRLSIVLRGGAIHLLLGLISWPHIFGTHGF
jgi:hypothetical protein